MIVIFVAIFFIMGSAGRRMVDSTYYLMLPTDKEGREVWQCSKIYSTLSDVFMVMNFFLPTMLSSYLIRIVVFFVTAQ